MITDLNIKCKIIKLPEDSIGENLVDLEFGKVLDTITKTIHEREVLLLDFIKIRNSCSAKDTAKRMKKKRYRLGSNACKKPIW